MKKILFFVFVCVLASAQVMSIGDRFNTNAFSYKGTPGVAATLATRTVYLAALWVVNNTGSAVTIRLRDRSTDCASAACPLIPDDLSVAANSVTAVTFPLLPATSGVSYVCSSSSTSVIVWAIGTY